MNTNATHQALPAPHAAPAHETLSLCRKVVAQIEAVKAATHSAYREGLNGSEHLLRLALNEAESLAWETDFPHLVFPALAEEKARSIANWQVHQHWVRQTHERLVLAA